MSRTDSSSPPDSLPPQSVRTTISLLLFMHLFAVTLAVAAYPKSSALEERLLTVLGPYLQVLNLDATASIYETPRWYLTHGMPTDIDFAVEITVRHPDGSEAPPVVIPAADLSGMRRLRHQALANALGTLTNNENAQNMPEEMQVLLPKALSAGVLHSQQGASGSIRCVAHYIVNLEDRDSADAARRDPNSAQKYNNVYEAQVLLNGNTVDLLKTTAKGEVAPVTPAPSKSKK